MLPPTIVVRRINESPEAVTLTVLVRYAGVDVEGGLVPSQTTSVVGSSPAEQLLPSSQQHLSGRGILVNTCDSMAGKLRLLLASCESPGLPSSWLLNMRGRIVA